MKKVRCLYAAALFMAALLLGAFFVCTLKIGDLTASGDLASGLGTVIAFVLTFIPFVCALPVSAAMIVFGIVLLARGDRKKVALISLVILSIFLPIFLFAVVIDGITVAAESALFSAVLFSAGAVYCCAFGLSVAYFCMLRREQKRGAAEGEG